MRQAQWFIVWFALLALLLSVTAILSCFDDDDDDEKNRSLDDDDDDDDDSSDDDTSDGFACDEVICTDALSGLTWQKDADCCYDWEDAKDYCESLELGGYNDWRLPGLSELRSLIRGCDATATGGDCNLAEGCMDWDCRNDPCKGCDYYGGPGSDGHYLPGRLMDDSTWCWSSSEVTDRVNYAWYVDFNGAVIQTRDIWTIADVRCVR